jgi:hypothetical protein
VNRLKRHRRVRESFPTGTISTRQIALMTIAVLLVVLLYRWGAKQPPF